MKKAVTKQVKREVTAEVKKHHERILRKGRQEGIRETLLFLLTKRFGRLPAKKLSLAILDARSLDELFSKSR